MIRLNKFIASTGKYSRREADRIVFDGGVTVNGEPVMIPAFQVDPEKDKVKVLGKLLQNEGYIYVKFYKPKGVITAYGDRDGKKNLQDFEFFRNMKLAYSGRLDYLSEGLIIFSNDGSMIHNMQTPKYKVDKEYIVSTETPLDDEWIQSIESGITVEGFSYKPCKVSKLGRNKYRVIITEGKYRQIRKIFGFYKVEIKKLFRIRIANVKIDNLMPGDFTYMKKEEVKELKKCLGLE